MANKKSVALSEEQLKEIIGVMKTGGAGFHPNERIATCLLLEANLGLRIQDILNLRLGDIVKDGARYRLDIREQKTNKERIFTVPIQIYQYIEAYCSRNDIESDDIIFPITERAVQKYLQKVVLYLGYKEPISTHSFRKFFATQIYKNNNYDIFLVMRLLQHSSVVITQRYIGMEAETEKALENHIFLM